MFTKSIRLVVSAAAGLTWAGVALAQTWNVNSNGSWGTATNWSPASVPNGTDASASLLNIITAPRTVTLNLPVTLGNLTFGGNFAYTIGGSANSLTFDVAAGNAALNATGTAAHTISRPIVLNDTLVIDQGSSGILTLSGARSGTGGLIKNGTGQVTLSGVGSFTGQTQINEGTLLYNTSGAIPAASLVTIGDGIGAAGSAVLDLNAAMSAAQALNVTLASDGVVVQNNNRLVRFSAVSGTGELRLNSAVGNAFQITGTGGSTTFSGAVTGGIALNSADPSTGSRFSKTGAATLTLDGNNTYVARTFINGGSLLAASNTALGAASTGFDNATFVYTTGSLQLSNNITLAERIYLNGTGGGAGALRNFSGNNTITGDVTLGWTASGVAAAAASIATDAGSTLTISGNIDGPQSLTKVGAGLLILGGSNTWSGATIVSAGTLQLGAATGMPDATVLTVNGGTLDLNGFSKTVTSLTGTGGAIALGTGALTVNQLAARTYAGVISGAGSLTKSGASTLTLSGANTYSGGTSVNAGILSGNSTSLQGSIVNNATVAFNQAGAGTYAGAMSGTGRLTKSGAGVLILTGANTYAGGTTVSAGTLQGNSTSLQGNIAASSSAVVFDQTAAGTYAGVMSGNGSLTKTGAGTLTLTSVNSYSGGTRFNGGTLAVASDAQLGTGSLTFNGGGLQTNAVFSSTKAVSLLGAGTINTNGFNASLTGAITGAGSLVKTGAGTLTLTGNNTFSGGSTVSAGTLQGNTTSLRNTIVNNAAVVFNQTATGTYAGVMSGTGSLTKIGAGALTFSGANTYSGGTTVNAGSLRGTTTSLQGNIVNNASVVFNQTVAGTYAGAMSGTGSLTKNNAGTLTLTGANTYSGGTTVNAGTLQGNTTSVQGDIVNNASAVFDQDTAGTYAAAMSGTGALTKLGAGNLTLGGVNTFNGPTAVNAGTLTVLGSMTSNLTLASGAALTGTGIVGGISAAAGSIVAPGNPQSTLTANGAYAHSDGAVFRVHADAGGAASRLDVNGAATLAGGTVDVQAEDGNYAPATRYTILNASAGVDGSFSSVTSSLVFLTPTLEYDPTNVFLTLARNDIDFAAVALTLNQRQVANALDQAAAGNAFGDIGTVIGAVTALSAPQARSAYESMGGLMHTLLPTIGISDATQFNRATASRLRARNDGTIGTGLAWSGIQLASAPAPKSDASALFASSGATRTASDGISRNVWLSGYGLDGDLDGDASSGAYDYRISGLIVGVDTTDIDRRWTAGLNAAFSDWRVRNDGRGDRSDVKAYRLGAYGRFTDGPIRVDSMVGYGQVDYKTDRRIVFGTVNRTAHADYSGDQFTANLVGRFRVEQGPYGIEPFAAVQYVRESQDDFIEAGADSINLAVAGRTLKSTRGTLGARVDRAFETEGGKGLVEVRAGYSREFSGVPRIDATFVGDPTRTGVGIVAENFDRDSWLAGAGVSFAPKKNLTLYVDLNGDFQSQGTLVSVMAGMRLFW